MADDPSAQARTRLPSTGRQASSHEAAQGSSVEPARPARAERKQPKGPAAQQAEHYELRDPSLELTYRARTFEEIATQAEHLGASRFTAVHADGSRTPMQKIDGTWLPARPKPPPDLLTTLDDVIDLSAGLEVSLASGAPNSTRASAVPAPKRATPGNKDSSKAQVQIDAQAERAAMVARIESALQDRYIIKRAPITVGDMTIGSTEYRFRGNSSRVAFTESNLRLTTDTNSPSVARSMIDLAQARGWTRLRVSGSEDFRRMVWVEATSRGVKTVGYEPNLGDLSLIRREKEARQINRIEPTPETSSDAGRHAARANPAGPAAPPSASEKSSTRGGSRKTVIAAIDAILLEKKVPEAKRLAVLAAAEKQLSQMARQGHVPKVKVYDRSAERRPQVSTPSPDLNRQLDRAAPTHAR